MPLDSLTRRTSPERAVGCLDFHRPLSKARRH